MAQSRQALTLFPKPSKGKPTWIYGDGVNDDDEVRGSDTPSATTNPEGAGPGSGGAVTPGANCRDGEGAASASDTARAAEGTQDLAERRGATRLPEGVRGYVVSLSGKHNFRRLHMLGRCWRVLGVDYSRYEFLGEETPPPRAYDDFCGKCWRSTGKVQERPPGFLAEDALEDNSPASEDASSSTDVGGD